MEVFNFQSKNRMNRNPFFKAGLAAFCMLFLYAATAQAWWNEDWEMRRTIDFDTTAQGADIQESVSNVPILLRLHSGNFDFSKTKPDGGDLRFVAADDVTALKYQIDTFDVIDEVALIWVNVPEIKANSSENRIYIYYGNQEAVDSQEGQAVFANGHTLVYHLSEAQGTPQDATTNKNHSSHFSGGQSLPAVVGNGISLFGGRDSITVPYTPALNLAKGFTLSTWIKIKHPGSDGYLFSQLEHGKGIIVGLEGERVYARVINEDAVVETEGDAGLTQGNWHNLVITARPGEKLSLFIDGRQVAEAALPAALPGMITDLSFGSADDGSHQLAADLDEIHLSSQPRSPAWIKAIFSSQTIQSKLVSYGAEISGGGGSALPGNYLNTIAGNITWDGWLIIALLVILGIGGMLVLVSKSYSFYLNQKDNHNFQASFSEVKNSFNHTTEFDDIDNSSLYRIYRNGCDTISALFSDKNATSGSVLNEKDMNTLKASLERSYIEETKRFNNWIMIMTLTISGGPFLGLLGTVWGVMNTFAAMAEAGEANIMAIAPGVASALATTVFGLIVAIPALFGYNYLAGRIKDQSADIGIFIDEFILLVERHHGEEK